MTIERLNDEPSDPTPEEHQQNLAFIQSILERKLSPPASEQDPHENPVVQSLIGKFMEHAVERSESVVKAPRVSPTRAPEVFRSNSGDPNLPGLIERWKRIVAERQAELEVPDVEAHDDRPSVMKRAIGK